MRPRRFAPVYRIHGNPESNMLSRLASVIEYKIDMTPNFGKDFVCAEGWVTYNNLECYKVMSGNLNYAAAVQSCEDLTDGPDSKLLHVVDSQENGWVLENVLGDFSVGADESVWIGLDDLVEEGVWRWPDGTSGGYTNWDPEAAVGGDCVSMRGDDGLWVASSCASTMRYVCECESVEEETLGTNAPTVSPPPTAAPTTLDSSCPALGVLEGGRDITPVVADFTNFFYPTKCQGSWELIETLENEVRRARAKRAQ